jgi:inner membrane transporter RhtA
MHFAYPWPRRMLPCMTTPAPAQQASTAEQPADSGRLTGMAMMFGSALSNQLGAATGALAFPWIGPAGVVAVRQWVAAIVLMAIGRPKLRTFTRRQWWPVVALAAVFAIMNLSLYTAIDRVGLGLAVTLEFLGPLTVALVASRRRVDLVCALVAGAAVLALLRPRATTDYLGLGLGLVAAACWAAYIVLNRLIGARLPGAQGSGAAAGLSGLLYIPVGVLVFMHHPPSAKALGCAAAAGVLSSAVPFLVDMLALRRVPTQFFGVFMSVHPVAAALVGWIVLGQGLPPADWLAIGAIVAANAVSALAAARRPALGGGIGPGGGRFTTPGPSDRVGAER